MADIPWRLSEISPIFSSVVRLIFFTCIDKIKIYSSLLSPPIILTLFKEKYYEKCF